MKAKDVNNSRAFPCAKAELAVSRMRKTSLKRGLSKLITKGIETEIIAARKAKILKST